MDKINEEYYKKFGEYPPMLEMDIGTTEEYIETVQKAISIGAAIVGIHDDVLY